jgi:hypothetical protein
MHRRVILSAGEAVGKGASSRPAGPGKNLSGAAARVYSTYLGGSSFDSGQGIAVDGAGNAYVTGWTGSTTFPTTAGAFQTTFADYQDAFVAKVDATGSQLLFSTYLGGSDQDQGYGIAVFTDALGNTSVYVVGRTGSSNFPTKNALQAQKPSGGNGADAFVTKVVL